MSKIPFPQANSLERIYGIFMSFESKGISKYDMMKKENLAEREGAYYLDALYFLGFIEKYNTKYFLSMKGIELQKNCMIDGKKVFAKEVLSHEFFSKVYSEINAFSDEEQYKEYIVQLISNNYGLGTNTAKRRMSTVIAWIQWLKEYAEEE